MPPGLTRNHSLLFSEPYEIVAGADRRFFVHSDIIATKSEPLHRTANSTTGRTIDLSDWDAATVGRLVEFLYDGSYQAPEPIPGEGEGREGAVMPDTVQSLPDEEELGGENTLLAHAKVYALAKDKQVEGLEIMALKQLKMSLEKIKRHMSTGAVGNFFQLLDYIDDYGCFVGSKEPIRELVSKFAAENFVQLYQGKGLDQGGDIAADTMFKVMGRCSDIEKKILGVEDKLKESRAECAMRVGELSEVTGKLEVAEREVQRLKDYAAELGENVRRLEATNVELLKPKESVVGPGRSHGGNKVVGFGVGAVSLPGGTLFYIVGISVLVIMALLHQNVPPGHGPPPTPEPQPTQVIPPTSKSLYIKEPLQPLTIDSKSFKKVCEYYEAHPWADSTYVTIGEMSLGEACGENK